MSVRVGVSVSVRGHLRLSALHAGVRLVSVVVARVRVGVRVSVVSAGRVSGKSEGEGMYE